MTIQNEVSRRIQSFTAELEALVRAAALEAVAAALGGARASVVTAAPAAGPARRRRARATSPRSTPVSHRPTRTPAPVSRRMKSAKHDPKIVEALAARAAAWIKSNPGKGMEAIGVGLKVPTSALKVPVAALLAAKTIKKSGKARGTKYAEV